MRKIALVAVLLCTSAQAARTSEVLVTTAGVQMPALPQRVWVEVFNYGPNALHCSFGTAISGNAFWTVAAASGGTPGAWRAEARTWQAIFCSAVSANQLTGAATIVNELDGSL